MISNLTFTSSRFPLCSESRRYTYQQARHGINSGFKFNLNNKNYSKGAEESMVKNALKSVGDKN